MLHQRFFGGVVVVYVFFFLCLFSGCICMLFYTIFYILSEHYIVAPLFVLTQCEPVTSTAAGTRRSHSCRATWSKGCIKRAT